MSESAELSVRELPLSDLEVNRLSANAQDAATFAATRASVEKWGMIQFPVVKALAGGKYRIIAGHHRIRAWAELDHETCPCYVLPEALELSPEEEFNLVNDLNRIAGQTSDGALLRIVRREGLRPELIRVHGLPRELLTPRVDRTQMRAMDEEATRRAKVHELTQKVAWEIAQVMVDDMDVMVTVLVSAEKVAAVLRLPVKQASIRAQAPALREELTALVERFVSEVPGE